MEARMASARPFMTVIISTYNSEAALQKVLLGYLSQTYRDFELIVADDGSGPGTADLVNEFGSRAWFPVRHLWHEDQGYRRQEILNQAIVNASCDYILFTDGDCIPRSDFLAVHAAHARPGHFLSGGYCKLGSAVSSLIGTEQIASGACFDIDYLGRHERLGLSNRLKLGSGQAMARFLDAVTTAKATFNNCNVSAWKADLLAVNGYDERMKYGGADREIGERLVNRGIRGIQIRHRAVCLHLDHPRPYKTNDSLRANRAIRDETKRLKRAWTEWGIERGDRGAEQGASAGFQS
jgi:glycosyltransferase involved in cell wall biosynthesis